MESSKKKPTVKPITQEDIARQAGVSRSIVSRVLSNAPQSNISPATRARVLETARELDYKPKAAVQRHHNIVIGLYDIGYLNRYYFSTIISGIAHKSGEFDFDLQFLGMKDAIKEQQPNLYFLNRPNTRNVKGYIVVDQGVRDEEILKIRDLDIPFVLVNREIKGEDVPCVLANESKVMYDMTSYLINKGCRTFSLLVTSRAFDRDSRKIQGFKKALEEAGLPFEESMVYETVGQRLIERINMVMSILNSGKNPSAILTVHDDVAVHVISLALDMGLRVPEDVAVAGCNDTPIASVYPIPLTSIRPPLLEMGESAIVLLENLIEGKEVKNKKVVLDSSISIRDSA